MAGLSPVRPKRMLEGPSDFVLLTWWCWCRYRQKRHERNFNKRIKYQCRKTLADSRPRVRGRFARNDDAGAVMPHETKKALAEKAKKEKQDTGPVQPAKPPSVQPFMPSTQGRVPHCYM